MKSPNPNSRLGRVHARVSGWQLPVRIPVPNRDDLIAMGLMTLAFGLIIGVAIGPALGKFGNAGATVVPGVAATEAETPEADEVAGSGTGLPPLGAPAGSESPASKSIPPPDVTASVPSADPPPDSSGIPADPEPDVPDTEDGYTPPEKRRNDDGNPPRALSGTPLKGTVVSQGTTPTSYAVADDFGNVLALHAETSPPLAAKVSTRIEPLENGTFGEARKWTTDGEKAESPLRGVVSFIDPVTGWIVISNRGASIAVDAAEVIASGELEMELGSLVEGLVEFPEELREDPDSGPLLVAIGLEAIGEPGDLLELNGRVLGVDEEAETFDLAPDSGGRLDGEIVIRMPAEFDPATLAVGRTVNATAEVSSGGLTLTGLSDDQGRKAADDLFDGLRGPQVELRRLRS